MKEYIPPKDEVLEIKSDDIITTSDIEARVETVPIPDGPGAWEAI